eukprot:5270608-Lingulodinium_polyedra.AAC.1
MRTEDPTVAQLRKRCSNTLFTAAAILSKDGLQQQVRMVRMMVGPFYDAHSQHTADLRGPEAT